MFVVLDIIFNFKETPSWFLLTMFTTTKAQKIKSFFQVLEGDENPFSTN
jgi:hypothetical protein